VTEIDPVRALEAAMDGNRVVSMADAAPVGDLFITVTGNKSVLRREHFAAMKDGAIIANSGHFNVEIDIPALERMSASKRTVRPFVEEYRLTGGKRVYLLGEGRLINLAAAEGHPAMVMDMSFANQALCEYMSAGKTLKKVRGAPTSISRSPGSSRIDGCPDRPASPAQEEYLSSWTHGTSRPGGSGPDAPGGCASGGWRFPVANGRRPPRIGFWLLIGFIILAGAGQAVPLYTDWLWYNEVGFTEVFTTVLSLRGWLFLGVGGVVFLFVYGNLWLAARTAAPDVLWELDDQLGLPGRAVLEPLIRRLLVPVITVIALLSGLRAGASWEMMLGYVNATPFGVKDPLFGRDLSFFVFELPLWRFLYGGAMTLVIGTLLLSVHLRPAPEPRPDREGPRLPRAPAPIFSPSAPCSFLRAVGSG
jgi:hypothetical protein